MKILRQYWIGFLVILLLLTSIYLIYRKLSQKEIPPHLIVGVGRIDGDLISLNTKYAGRVKEIFVEEGKEVKKGEIIAVLSGKEYEAELEAVRYNIKAKEKEIEAKEIELEILKKTLPENVKKARSSLKINLSLLKELEKQIETVKSIVEKDEKDYERFKNLYQENAISKQQLEEIETKMIAAKSMVDQVDAKLGQLKAKESQVKAKLAQVNVMQGYTVIKAPFDGYVLKKMNDEGDMVAPGMPIFIIGEKKLQFIANLDESLHDKIADKGEVLGEGMVVATVIDPETLYLKIFVDTINNGKIKIGDRALIFLDAYPDRPIEARVVRISQRAEFTPKEVAVKEDRIQRVYAVHIKPLKVEPVLKLGLPAVGVISITGKGLPKSLKELPEI